MSISDTNILELLVSNHLVQIRKCKISKKITRIGYIKYKTQWSNTVTNGNVTISLAQYSKYQYIYLRHPHTSSQTKYTVVDIHHGLIQYKNLILTIVNSIITEEVTPFVSAGISSIHTTNMLQDVVVDIEDDLDAERGSSDGGLEAGDDLE